MEIIEQQERMTIVRLMPIDVVAISNALNEALEHLEDWEFQTRIGVTKDYVKVIMVIRGAETQLPE